MSHKDWSLPQTDLDSNWSSFVCYIDALFKAGLQSERDDLAVAEPPSHEISGREVTEIMSHWRLMKRPGWNVFQRGSRKLCVKHVTLCEHGSYNLYLKTKVKYHLAAYEAPLDRDDSSIDL